MADKIKKASNKNTDNMKSKNKDEETEIKSSLAQKPQAANGISPTFCVAMLKNGSNVKLEGQLEEFQETLKDADFAWINVKVDDLKEEGSKVASVLGFKPSIVHELVSERFSGYEDQTTELGLLLPAVRVDELEVEINKLIILMKNNIIVTIHGEHVTRLAKFARYAVTFFKKVPKNLDDVDKISLVLVRILDENNERNFDGIRSIQEQGEEISKYLIHPTFPKQELGADIYKMKHALISYLEALWASLDVVHYLRYGDAELITDDPITLQKVGMLSTDLTRQISISEQMSTVLASGLEVLQSIYNNQLQTLNNRLALVVTWLTVLGTAVLVPNTIATIFGVAPIAEQLSWQIMLWIIFFSTLIAVVSVYWFVKRKGVMPKKMDTH
ncbi:magnesium transporter CorA [Candidatus Woesearchaeota archaeon]|jgi:magnesium transporter|nr:magnesium transporter CorA [Candidatus Woesearchaeota archaeon]MDP6647972.1 CorA family divalent cation transporter [Candidatus Woesearchaeota archaeon]|tara:strand:- start:10303 stop:11460 length:1158 start_codon:yes stop_codon:yes gene_type:complete